jgi:hypothetical protein
MATMRPVKNSVEASQGKKGVGVRYVLGWSLFLAVVALGAISFFYR